MERLIRLPEAGTEPRRRLQRSRQQITIIFLHLFFNLHIPTGTSGACLGAVECDCEIPPGQHLPLINCRYRQLDAIPTFQSTDLQVTFTELTLAGNNIRFVPDESFRGLRLTRLDLSGNPLVNISRLAFEGLEPELQELLIQLDPTSEFPTIPLEGLVRLRLLKVVGYGQASLPTDDLATLVSLERLELTKGQLSVLHLQDFAVQRNSLRVLNLEENQLTEIPTEAISILENLTELSLARNVLTRVRDNAFDGCKNLTSIDLSGNGLTENLEPLAFGGLEGTLKDLTLASCQLRDGSLEALRPLWALSRLNMQNNDLANLPDEFFTAMTSLSELNLDSNRLTSIHQNTFHGLTDVLQTLQLGHNPLLVIAADAMAPLTALQELHLDGLPAALRLDRETLSGQRDSLETLSLFQTSLGDSVWSVITGLSALKFLDLSSMEVTSIPFRAFQSSPQLQSIDLSSNNITSIARGSFLGLEDGLNNIRLNSNQITTLDRCSFDGLRRLNYTRLGLAGNQMACDCRLRWLYVSARAESSLRFAHLNWRCDSGKLMVELNENDFVCQSSDEESNSEGPLTTDGLCPDISGVLDPTDSTTSSETVEWIFAVRVTKVTSSEISVNWSLEGINNIRGFTLTFEPLGHEEVNGTRGVSISGEFREYVLDDLRADTAYEICIEVEQEDLNDEQSPVVGQRTCTQTTTLPTSDPPGWGVIFGALFGAIAALVVIVLLVGYLVMRCRHHLLERCFRDGRPEETGEKVGGMPRLGRNSKRFFRNCESGLPGCGPRPTGNLEPKRLSEEGGPKFEQIPSLSGNLEPRRLSEEDRTRVLSMLQASLKGSVFRLTNDGLASTPADDRAFDNVAFSRDDHYPDVFATHVYEVIPEVIPEVNHVFPSSEEFFIPALPQTFY